MAAILDENLNFVILIEENKDILEKSQAPSAKKKKEEACIEFVDKWAKLSGKQLTHSALLKKINNLKTRAKSDHNKGKVLALWQTKILEITKVCIDSSNIVKKIHSEILILMRYNLKFFDLPVQ